MKTFSIGEFEKLIARNDWQRRQNLESVLCFDYQPEEFERKFDSQNQATISKVIGWATKTSTLDGMTITYGVSYCYDKFDPDSICTEPDGDEEWEVDGIVVVDENGDDLEIYEVIEYLTSDFSNIDYSVFEIEKAPDVDVGEDSDMERFTL